jgi:hypothetical protein
LLTEDIDVSLGDGLCAHVIQFTAEQASVLSCETPKSVHFPISHSHHASGAEDQREGGRDRIAVVGRTCDVHLTAHFNIIC